MTVQILVGDVKARLADLPDRSVHCVVTSPPYWNLRDYGVPGQLGLEKTPEEYVQNMVAVFREVKRVLRDDGTLWLNIGDSYARDGGAKEPSEENGTLVYRGGTLAMPASALKTKDLVGIPWMLAFALRADGWYLRCDIIWHKPNPMPESTRDRPTKAHEYLFLLSKKERYYYDDIAIREKSEAQSRPKRPAGWNGNNGAHESLAGRHPDKQSQHGQRHAGFNGRWEQGAVTGRSKRSVWTIATQPFAGAHFATFPAKLVEPCILAGTSTIVCGECGAPYKRLTKRTPIDRTELPADHPEYRPSQYESKYDGLPDHLMGGSRGRFVDVETLGWEATCAHQADHPKVGATILDPFGGAGTTALVAERHGRNAILIELKPEYAEIAGRRITEDSPMFQSLTLR